MVFMVDITHPPTTLIEGRVSEASPVSFGEEVGLYMAAGIRRSSGRKK